MVLDSVATSYIGWPPPAFCLHLRRALFVPFDNAKVLHFSSSSKFRPSVTCKNLLTDATNLLKYVNSAYAGDKRFF